jgi:hypothetical protein
MELPVLERALDEAHAAANAAFLRRDCRAYMSCFAPDLAYRRANGDAIGWKALSRDVSRQLKTVGGSLTTYHRLELTEIPGGAREQLSQESWAFSTAFAVVHRVWHLERTATFTWVNTHGIWQIKSVDVHNERLSHAAWKVGSKPTLPLIA